MLDEDTILYDTILYNCCKVSIPYVHSPKEDDELMIFTFGSQLPL